MTRLTQTQFAEDGSTKRPMTPTEIFDMVREYRNAPSNTASAMTVEQWQEAWVKEWQRANRASVALEEIKALIGEHEKGEERQRAD